MQSEMTRGNLEVGTVTLTFDHFLDITGDVCPMTFVRSKVLLERMASSETLLILLNAGEPLTNIPRSMADHGYRVTDLIPVDSQHPEGRHYLRVEKP